MRSENRSRLQIFAGVYRKEGPGMNDIAVGDKDFMFRMINKMVEL
jgi:hypothetical protein